MDAKEAIEYLKKARALHVERYGDSEKRLGLYDKAIEALEKAPALEVENAKLKKALAECAGY